MSAPPTTLDLAPGLTISRILTGLWQIADMERDGSKVDPEHAAQAMDAYVAAGLTTFDMADHYGSAEEIAGHYRDTRAGGDVQLFTKWVPEPGPVSRHDVRAAVQRSLDRLRTERIDLLQFHAWRYLDPSWLDGLLYLDELRQEGLIRHLGLTNVDATHLDMVLQSGVPVIILAIGYGSDADEDTLRALAKSSGGQYYTGDLDTIRRLYKILSTYF